MKKLLTLCALAILTTVAFAQKPITDNGAIVYKVELSGIDDPQVQQMFKDAKMELGFLNDQFRMDMNMPMNRTQSFTAGDSVLILMEMMGNKMLMTVPKDAANSRKLDESSYEITETKDTKTIAGYKTKKHIVKTKDNQTFTVYATDELPMTLGEMSPYTKIKGAPLEYDMAQGPYKMKVTATEVKLGSETKEQYTYDTTGYTRMTMDQMMRMMGGGQKESQEHDHSDPNHKH
jgi:hypothetical protein